MALAAPGADAAAYDWTYGVARAPGHDHRGRQRRSAPRPGETPALELYGGNATTVLSLNPAARASTPAARLRGPSGPSSLVVPGRVRFGWNEQVSTGAYGTKRRCRGRTAKAVPRRLVHVVRMEREGERIRIRWAIPLPRLGKAGCTGAGMLPTVIAEDVYAASTFDHREIRVRRLGLRQPRARAARAAHPQRRHRLGLHAAPGAPRLSRALSASRTARKPTLPDEESGVSALRAATR